MSRQNNLPTSLPKFCAFIDTDRSLCLGRVRQLYPSGKIRVWREYLSINSQWCRHDGHNIFLEEDTPVLYLSRDQYDTISPLEISFN